MAWDDDAPNTPVKAKWDDASPDQPVGATKDFMGHTIQPPDRGDLKDRAQTTLEKYGNMMTLNYLPNLQAAAMKNIGDPLLKMTYGDNVTPTDYVKERDQNRSRINAETERNPKSARLGDVLGIGNMMGTGGGGASKSLSLLKAFFKNAAQGFGYGAVANPGDEPGKLSDLQLFDRAVNGGVGAVTAGAIGAGAQGVKNLSGAPKAINQIANEQALAQAHPMIKDYRSIENLGNEQELGQWARDSKVVQAGDNHADVAAKADAEKERAWSELEKVYDTGNEVHAAEVAASPPKSVKGYVADTEFSQFKPDANTTINYDSGLPATQTVSAPEITQMSNGGPVTYTPSFPDRQVTDFDREPVINNKKDKIITLYPGSQKPVQGFNPVSDRKEILDKITEQHADNPKLKQILKQANDYLNDQAGRFGDNPISPTRARKLKTGLDSAIDYSRDPRTNDPITEMAYGPIRQHIAQKVDNQIANAAMKTNDPTIMDKFLTENKNYGNASKFSKMAGDYALRQKANARYGMLDRIVGAGATAAVGGSAAATGHVSPEAALAALATGAAATQGSKMARTMGPGVVAGMGNALENVPKGLPLNGNAPMSIADLMGNVGQTFQSVNPKTVGRAAATASPWLTIKSSNNSQ